MIESPSIGSIAEATACAALSAFCEIILDRRSQQAAQIAEVDKARGEAPDMTSIRSMLESEFELPTSADCLPLSISSFAELLAASPGLKPPSNRWPFYADPEPKPSQIPIWMVKPFKEYRCVGPQWLHWVTVGAPVFETCMLPSFSITIGLVSFDGQQTRCMERNPDNLERFLRKENRPLDEAPAEELASLISTALGNDSQSCHEVVTVEKLEAIEARSMASESATPYRLDRVELQRIAEKVVPPSMVRTDIGGWRLQFTTLFGWMHQTNTLILWTANVWPNFEMVCDQQILTERIFAEMPNIMY